MSHIPGSCVLEPTPYPDPAPCSPSLGRAPLCPCSFLAMPSPCAASTAISACKAGPSMVLRGINPWQTLFDSHSLFPFGTRSGS